VLDEGAGYGKTSSQFGQGHSVVGGMEFVIGQPDGGPSARRHGRHAAISAPRWNNLLEAVGYKVARESTHDAGSQRRRFWR